MKRSEMIKNIHDLTKMLLGVENEIFAGYLLSDLEAKGMLPPFSDQKFQESCRKDQEPSGNRWDNE